MSEIDERYKLKDIKDDLKKRGISPPSNNKKEKNKPLEFISYSAVVLKDISKDRLMRLFKNKIPEGWKFLGDHMTINMGKISEDMLPYLGMSVSLYGIDYAINDRVLCMGVNSGKIKTKNPKPHITIAINEKVGAKPRESNDIPEYEFIELKRPIRLSGYVKQIPHKIN